MLFEAILLFLSVLPECLGVDLTYYVEEGKSPGTLVGDIAADSHFMDTVPPKDHHLITFSQLQQGVPGSAQLFRVSKRTGKLYTAQTLDAESMCRFNTECFEIVKVAVRRAETFMMIQKIKVVIQDVNDQQPQFPEKKISIEFSERDGKGTTISIPNAVDRDVSISNSRIAYQLKKSKDEPFTLIESKRVYGKSKLAIRLEDRLNRERKDSYVVQVLAKDGGSPPKQSFLDVLITVRDENDNAPTFSQSEYNVSVKNEHYGSLPIFILMATDSDSGKNGKVTYHFSPDTSDVAKTHFKLNELTGEIFLRKKFATGQQMTYKLFVEAADNGSPPLSSMALVQVNLVNQENNPPHIDINFISASIENRAVISEDIKVGSFIAYVMVTDHDAGLNGEVLCDLSHDNFQLQSLGPKEYKVTVKNPLDRETKDYHDITIRCQDKGSPPLYSKNKFSIKVMDVNDVRPQFSKDVYKFSVYENQKSKFPVGSISAKDPDLGPGGKLTYFLQTNIEQFLPFQISDDGLISTVLSLDYEFQDIYKFMVLVKDSGSPPLNNTVDVVVEVRDENDNAPYFTFPSVNPFSIEVHYHPDNINNITVLKASDKDSRENAYLKYEITGGNDKQLFTVNRYTGLLSFTREPTQLDAGSYELHFVVKDSGSPFLSAKTTLLLMVTVSSKTPAEILNVVHMKSDDNIQMYLLIVIVFVAVTVSVAITAPISICIIRCYEQRNMSHAVEANPYDKCVTDQGNLTSQSHLAISWPDVAVAIRKDSNTSWSTLPAKNKEPFATDGFSAEQHRSGSGIKFQTATEVVYEEIGVSTSGAKTIENRTFMVPVSHNFKTSSNNTDCRKTWREEDSGYSKKIPDLFASQIHKTCSSLTGHSHSIQTKPILHTFNSFSDTRPIDPSNSIYGSQQWTSVKHPTADLTGFQSQDLLQLCRSNGNNDKGISSFLADNQSYMSTSAPASASVSYLYHQSHYPSSSHQNQGYFGQPVQSENSSSVMNYFVQEPASPKSTNLVFT